MKPEIHPEYKEIKVACSCGNTFVTGSTIGHDLQIEICAKCHPFYTGTQKLIDTAGRVDRFRQKYSQNNKPKASTSEAKPSAAKASAVKTSPAKASEAKASTAKASEAKKDKKPKKAKKDE